MKQLQKWLGRNCYWNLCYRASRDGWSAQHFHRHCDNKGPTVVLVKANDCIFGGYTDQSWAPGTGIFGKLAGFPGLDHFLVLISVLFLHDRAEDMFF